MMRGSGSRTFWVLTGLAITFLIVFLIICVTMWGSLSALRGELQAKLQQKQELDGELQAQNKGALESENVQLDDRLSRLEQGLPQREYVPTLLKQIEQEALLTRNDVLELRQGEWRRGIVAGAPAAAASGAETTPAAGGAAAGAGEAAAGAGEEAEQPAGQRYEELDVTLRLKGSYRSGFDFLKALAAMRKMLYVKQIDVRRSGNAVRPDGSAEAEIQLEMTAYILEPTSGFPGRIVGEVVQ